MRQTLPLVDQVSALAWGLTDAEAVIYGYLREWASFPDNVQVKALYPPSGNELLFYVLNRSRLIRDLPLIVKTDDRAYRHLKALIDKGLIVHLKAHRADLIRFTSKGKRWNCVPSEIQDSEVGKNPDFEAETPEVGKNPDFTQYIRNNREYNKEGDESSVKIPDLEKKIPAPVAAAELPASTIVPEEVRMTFISMYFSHFGNLTPDEERIAVLWLGQIPLGMSMSLFCKFVNYWTERNESGKRMRFQLEKSFDPRKRMYRFIYQEKQFKGNRSALGKAGDGVSDLARSMIKDVLKPIESQKKNDQ